MPAGPAIATSAIDVRYGDRLRDASKAARVELRDALIETVSEGKLSQTQTAKLCATDQPTISKVIGGRTESVTIDQLARWLAALGCRVEVHVHKPTSSDDGSLTVVRHD